MSNDQDKNVRRFGRKNQKDRLTRPDTLFPPDDNEDVADTGTDDVQSVRQPSADFDLDSLNLPDTDAGALEMLSSLRDEVKAPVITPREERFPRLAPTTSEPQPQQSQKQVEVIVATPPIRSFFYNLFSILLLIATALTLVWFGFVWVDPQGAMNPFPPPTPFVVATVLPGEVGDSDFSNLPTPDADGQIFVVITDTPAPTLDSAQSPFPFVAEQALYVPNTNELGCNWWSIAGTVSDSDGNSIPGYRIRVTGTDIDETVFSGASQAFGDGGYELPLVGTPQEEQFTLQLLTPDDAPLSDEIEISTRADCDSNVAVINFVQNR